MMNPRFAQFGPTALVAALASTPAFAHHPMGGTTPSNFVEGFLSGIGHPVIGLDHLAFIVAAGLASAFLPGGLALAALFVLGTAIGTVIHLAALDLPFVEVLIAASVVVAGALIARGTAVPRAAWGALFAIGGLFHGHAYGEAVFGAEATPVFAYLAGFALIQFAIAAGVAKMMRVSADSAGATAMRVAGGVVLGVGVVFLAQATMPF